MTVNGVAAKNTAALSDVLHTVVFAPEDLFLLRDGAAFIIYTDIERDGMQCGVNLTALRHLAETSTVPVIAAGGVATLADVQALYPLNTQANLQGAISGRALYEGTLDLVEANAWIAAQQ